MNKKCYKILHITPHVGGGVGRVLLSYLAKSKEKLSFTNQVACLDYANENASAMIKKLNIKLSDKMSGKKTELLGLIKEADIVLIHWWNHPLLYDFLVRTALPPCRLIMWSHTSGFNPPAVFTEKILTYPDRFVFVTPISLETKEVKSLSDKQKRNLGVILATSDMEHVKLVKPKKHSGFNVGYIGTVDYAKIHPNFLNICNKINIPNVKFIVCGGSNEKEIKQEAERLGIAKKFKFTGPVSDITKYLSVFDVFGYPLAPNHYGACDQTLIESMAAGVVPVVLNNRMERNMIKNGVVGIVAKNEPEYIKAVETIYGDKNFKKLLSKNARQYAIKTFSTDKTAKDWERTFKEILSTPKNCKKWHIAKKIDNISSADVFIESLGNHGENFMFYCNAKNAHEKEAATQRIKKMAELINWRSKTKSTVHQYNSFLPGDKYLSVWSKIMKR